MKKTIFRTMLLAFGAIAAASLVPAVRTMLSLQKKKGTRRFLYLVLPVEKRPHVLKKSSRFSMKRPDTM